MTSSPISSLEELLKWNSPGLSESDSVPLVSNIGFVDELGKFQRPLTTPLVLFCHDMAGGYHEFDCCPEKIYQFPTFRFIHWDLIDIFVYFSHHFVTIPPASWVKLAHINGVRIYGTLIIEHDKKTACPVFESIFGTTAKDPRANYPAVLAHKLNVLRHHYGFDGWLINFENCFFDTEDRRVLQAILHFLRNLKNLGSEVVWYDAVTRNGALKWQNSLSADNSHFFRSCVDGIFLNYNWTPKLLASTQNMAVNSNESMRIFVGIDCFGRGCPGGGGFNTKEALGLVVKASESFPSRPLSVALFAPAWSFEKREELLHLVDCTPSSNDACASASAVYRLDRRFWRPLTPLLSRLRAVGSQSRHLYRPSCPWRGSITTNFSLGMGLFDTNRVRLKPWSQLAGQEVLPTCRVISATQGKDEQAGFDVEVIPEFVEYYLPGNSLRLSISRIDGDDKNLFLELFVFPNLSLSSVANLTIILKFESEKGAVKVFADICTVSWESVYVAEKYSVTGRKYINCSETARRGATGTSWICFTADIGSQLSSLSNCDQVTFVRRIGLELDTVPVTLLLGSFCLSDPHLCLL